MNILLVLDTDNAELFAEPRDECAPPHAILPEA
jgi:hypothetical protein